VLCRSCPALAEIPSPRWPGSLLEYLRHEPRGIQRLFLLGRAAEPLRPVLISRKDKIPWPIPLASTPWSAFWTLPARCPRCHCLLVFESSGHSSAEGTAQAFEKGARTAGTVFSLFALIAISALVYLRLYGTAVLERRMQAGSRLTVGAPASRASFSVSPAACRPFAPGAISWRRIPLRAALVARCGDLFPGHQELRWKLGTLTFTDAMLVLVFTMVGSAIQLPGVGGGAQALSIVAFTHLYGVEQEAAVACAMVLWLVTFASCTLAGVPILFREGWSLGDLRRMSQREDEQIDAEIAAR